MLISIFLFACSLPPKAAEVPDQSPQKIQSSRAAIEKINSLVDGSACANYSWKNRGKAPNAYMRGMALNLAKSVCSPEASHVKYISSPNKNIKGDAFTNYGLNPEGGLESLLTTYTLLIGLGMRESSGKHCVGRDMSANFSDAIEAEAGLFQTSYNIVSYHEETRKLFAANKNCMLDVFSKGVSCKESDAKTWGTGNGAKWQQKAKSCPAMATDVAAVTIRFSGGPTGHHGPLRRKEAEYNKSCEKMLGSVIDYVLDNESICDSL